MDETRNEYKIIAEFMEFYYIPSNDNPKDAGWYYNKNTQGKLNSFICRKTLGLRFEYDWQMLMRVILKIETLESQKFGKFKVSIYDDCCTIQATNRTKENTYSKSYCSKTKINSVYQSVLLFIDWYNKNKI